MREKYTTPIKKLNNTFNKNDIFIKRDDLIPCSFGGNKARKAKYFFEEIELQCNDYVVTYGSSSSNHCRIVANLAASKGLKCIIISPTENSQVTYNSYMMNLFGAKIINCKVSEVKEVIEQTLSSLTYEGYKPYFIQGGGHGNLGTKAYVEVFEEIRSYEIKNDIYFDYIFHASGTGTTQAGLVCGNILNRDNKNIVGISIARSNPHGGVIVLESINDYLDYIGEEKATAKVVNFVDDYILDGYGKYNKEILKTIKDVLVNEGVPLDKTYTGKAFWGMKKYIKKEQIKGKNILFIHTGGTPLFFDDLEELMNE